jgi:cellulose synthase/poly-beta-1,6-N-acetylglucosamine synthase-like glycosyltransferase
MNTTDYFISAMLGILLFLALYTYGIYPILVWLLARLFGRSQQASIVENAELPFVSLLIAAHNEETEIERRIQNALDSDYPSEKLEIVIASDGSTDRTSEIVRRYAHHGVRLLDFAERRGKAAVLNDAFPELSHSIVVLSDANTSFNRDAIRKLAVWFADSSIGVVCGRLVLTDPKTGRNVDSLYWKYETFLKKCESKLGALLGSNGGIYAIRKELVCEIPENTIVDDFVIPLLARERTGCRIVYDRDAVACEETPESIGSEFQRRVRIGAGDFQSVGLLCGLLNPRHGWLSFTFWSHKILRWLCPFFLVGALLLNLCLAAHEEFAVLLLAQVAFYVGSLLAGQLPMRSRFLRVFKLGAMFTTMNAALLVGFFSWLLKNQTGTWRRTERTAEALPRITESQEAIG